VTEPETPGDPRPTHPWNGVDGHDCADCPPVSIWKCDVAAHGGPRTDGHGRIVSTPAENLIAGKRLADEIVAGDRAAVTEPETPAAIWIITGWQADDVPHWEYAAIEAGSAEEAKAILLSKIGAPDDDTFDRPDTVWTTTDPAEWRVKESERPFTFILGGGCR
jgi:hypothetical protein